MRRVGLLFVALGAVFCTAILARLTLNPTETVVAAAAQTTSCPAGQPPTPSPGPGFVPTADCTGWVPADHPLAPQGPGTPGPGPGTPPPGPSGPCPAGQPSSPSPGPTFLPNEDCDGWVPPDHPRARRAGPGFDGVVDQHARDLVAEGRRIFRFDTFGDEAFWGDQLRLHDAIKGAALGGVGDGLSPKAALTLGLKVDVEALPAAVVQALRAGQVNLDDPATTVALLQANAVLGVTGFFDGNTLRSLGLQCAFCHSTVDDSFAPGIGRRLDGWANRDLNVGGIVALAPSLQPVTELLGVDDATVRTVLNSWGPGKFDAELFLDGKAFRPDGKTAATLIPPAYGLAGVNLHTWTGWGSVTHWNAFVANLEMHGKGTFYDPRLKDAARFPIAAKAGFDNVRGTPDLITSKLAALHLYQLAIPAPTPPVGSFDAAAVDRGKAVFGGAGRCATCHVPPIFTEPGWNMHTPEEIGIDNFQAERSPDRRYRTSPLKGLFAHQKGGFYHDGRFATLADVVEHYNSTWGLGLSASQKADLVEYLKSL